MSYTRKDIINELEKRGYKAIPNDVFRNNVKLEGIVIGDKKINPCIYVDDFIKSGFDLEETTTYIINIYEGSKSVDFNVNEILSKEWVLNNVFVALQKTSQKEFVIKRPTKFDGIEEYLYIKGSDYSIRINEGLLSHLDLSESNLWKRAYENTFCKEEISIQSISKAIGLFEDDYEDDFPLYVVTNKDKFKGSVAIFSDEVISFARAKGAKYLLALPSSIHEFLIYIVKDDVSLSELEEMKENMTSIICSVNENVVDEIERLGDKPYVIEI